MFPSRAAGRKRLFVLAWVQGYDRRVRSAGVPTAEQTRHGRRVVLAGLAVVIFALAAAKAVADLGAALLPHVQGALENDTLIYLTVGLACANRQQITYGLRGVEDLSSRTSRRRDSTSWRRRSSLASAENGRFGAGKLTLTFASRTEWSSPSIWFKSTRSRSCCAICLRSASRAFTSTSSKSCFRRISLFVRSSSRRSHGSERLANCCLTHACCYFHLRPPHGLHCSFH